MLRVTNNLISLERGVDELLLVNSFEMRPLYVKRGRNRFNRVLGAVERYRTIEDLGAAFPEDAAVIRLLLDYGILIDASAAEEAECLSLARPAARSSGKNRITLYLLVGESCNLACTYCLNGPRTYEKSGRAAMSKQIASQSIGMCLDQVTPGGVVEVAFFGGEPLMHWPLVKNIILHCEHVLKPAHPDKQIRYHLTSNLAIRPADLIEWVKRYDITIVCEVDGPPEIHDRCRPNRGGGGSHAQTARTIGQLVQSGVQVTLRATITAANETCLAEVAAHHAELGAKSSLFVPVRPINSDQEFFPEQILPNPGNVIAAALKLRRAGNGSKRNLFPFNDFTAEIRPGERQVVACGAPYGTTFVVRVNGDVYPCIYLVGQERYRLGNVAGSLDFRPLNDMLTELHVDNREDCRACAWRYACGGGCPVMYLARQNGAAGDAKVARYSRGVTCDLSQAILADMLWELADRSQRPGGAAGAT